VHPEHRAVAASPLLVGLSPEEADGLLQAARVRQCAAGERVVAEGSASDCLFILAGGSVRVEKRAAGEPVLLAVLREPGDFFGEMSLIDILPRSADVRADQPTRLLAFPKKELAAVFGRQPRIQMTLILNIARHLSLRLRQADERIVDLAAGAGPTR
jgi:CRP-like cAMP-binding protein